jgi:hypothetical protein
MRRDSAHDRDRVHYKETSPVSLFPTAQRAGAAALTITAGDFMTLHQSPDYRDGANDTTAAIARAEEAQSRTSPPRPAGADRHGPRGESTSALQPDSRHDLQHPGASQQ